MSENKGKEYTIKINGMTCAACSSRIEKKLSKKDGFGNVTVNLQTEKAKITTYGNASVNDAVKIIEDLGFLLIFNKSILPIFLILYKCFKSHYRCQDG